MSRVVFSFDVVCPYAYLASRQLDALVAATGAELELRPVLLGGIFRSIGAPDAPVSPPDKVRLTWLDLRRWADIDGAELRLPAGHPRRSVEAMRLLHAAAPEARAALMHALYRAYFVEGRDLADRAVLAEVAAGLGLAPALARIDDAAVKTALRVATEAAVAEGSFGVPSFSVVAADGAQRLFFGRDRLHLVAAALGGRLPQLPPPVGPRTVAALDFYFDFSSPFAYLGSTQIAAAAEGARVRWRPLLLGGLFQQIGTPDVPLFAASAAKQRYLRQDLDDWARQHGVPLRWPSRFPMRTVLPLRMLMAAPEERWPELAHVLFAAMWVDDLDISDAATLRHLGVTHGWSPEWLARAEAGDPALKQALRDATTAAQVRGVFGVPTFAVADQLFWGQDRLEHLRRALRGWHVSA